MSPESKEGLVRGLVLFTALMVTVAIVVGTVRYAVARSRAGRLFKSTGLADTPSVQQQVPLTQAGYSEAEALQMATDVCNRQASLWTAAANAAASGITDMASECNAISSMPTSSWKGDVSNLEPESWDAAKSIDARQWTVSPQGSAHRAKLQMDCVNIVTRIDTAIKDRRPLCEIKFKPPTGG